jgi:hypothetical protein
LYAAIFIGLAAEREYRRAMRIRAHVILCTHGYTSASLCPRHPETRAEAPTMGDVCVAVGSYHDKRTPYRPQEIRHCLGPRRSAIWLCTSLRARCNHRSVRQHTWLHDGPDSCVYQAYGAAEHRPHPSGVLPSNCTVTVKGARGQSP